MAARRTLKGRRTQRGATAVFVAIIMAALVIAATLAAETGRLYIAHRSLQKLANLAALDAARVMSGCSATELPQQDDIDSAVQDSLTRNGASSLYTAALVEAGKITTPRKEGTGTTDTRYLVPVPLDDSTAMQDAFGVRVTLTKPFPNSLIPFFSRSGAQMRVSATAEQPALGAVRIGSTTLALNQGMLNALLGALLNGNINLSVASYQALASVNVSAQALAASLGLTVQDLSDPTTINTSTPVLNNVLNGLVSALSGTVDAEVINALQSLAGQSNNNAPIPLGQILQPIGQIAGDVPFVNLQDLILALAMATYTSDDGSVTPIELPVSVSVPGGVTLKTFIKILEPPVLSPLGRAGQTYAKTAQIRIMLRISVGSLLTDLLSFITTTLSALLNALGGVLGLVTSITVLPNPPGINLGADVLVAPSLARLDRIDCPRASVNGGYPVTGLSGETAAATVNVGTFSGNASAAPNLDTSTSSWQLVRIQIDATHACIGVNLFGLCLGIPTNLGKTDTKVLLGLSSISVGSTSKTLNDVYQFTRLESERSQPAWLANGAGDPAAPASPTSENPQSFGSNTNIGLTLGLTTTESGSGLLGALTGIVSSLVNSIVSFLQPLLTLVNSLVSLIVTPLLNVLGIQLGIATVTMESVTIAQPEIVSTALPSVQ